MTDYSVIRVSDRLIDVTPFYNNLQSMHELVECFYGKENVIVCPTRTGLRPSWGH